MTASIAVLLLSMAHAETVDSKPAPWHGLRPYDEGAGKFQLMVPYVEAGYAISSEPFAFIGLKPVKLEWDPFGHLGLSLSGGYQIPLYGDKPSADYGVSMDLGLELFRMGSLQLSRVDYGEADPTWQFKMSLGIGWRGPVRLIPK